MIRMDLYSLLFGVVAMTLRSADVRAKIVHTSSGIVEGMAESGVHQFLGIPYAEPPVGGRRFLRPVWKARMRGTYNATYFRSLCPQPTENLDVGDEIDEDCLYLNIYAPLNASLTSLKAVMVWVHGGSYLFGSGKKFPGTALSISSDVVLVNINYRLGALGFLSTGDDNAVGNYGLWDQTMALEWVKVNIAAFGGDPDSVTIFGESAGSSSVSQLAISPFTEGLFQRVIAESGTAFSTWANYPAPLKPAADLAKRLECPTHATEELVNCLRQKSVHDILESQAFVTPESAFTPTYKTEFMPYTPHELVTTQINSSVARQLAELDFIIGQNSDECAMFLKLLLANVLEPGDSVDDVAGISQRIYRAAFRETAMTFAPDNYYLMEKITVPLEFMYSDWDTDADGVARTKMVIRLFSDIVFTQSIVQYARAHALLRGHWSTKSRTFSYLFDHRGSWMSTEAWRSGADHADEIPFVFGAPLGVVNATEPEKLLSMNVMKYWTNFAKSGSPNNGAPAGARVPVEWPVFEVDSEHYLELHTGAMTSLGSVGQRVYNDRVGFWLEYFPKQLEIFRKEPDPGQCYHA